MTFEGAVRQLLAFLVAKELKALCCCGAPATVESHASGWLPQCDACSKVGRSAAFTDWRDLAHAPAMRRLLAGEP